MPKITFVDHQGTEMTVDAGIGQSVMEAATQNLVPGIDADCGGACACATCHVYVDKQWINKLSEPEDIEKSMLDFAEGVRENSRLSCQITVTNELDGLHVTTPEWQ